MRKGADLLDFGGSHVMRVNTADAATRTVHLKHDDGGLLAIHVEKLLQYDHYEIHRRVIVVEQYDTEQRGRFYPASLGLENCTAFPLLANTHTKILMRIVPQTTA